MEPIFFEPCSPFREGAVSNGPAQVAKEHVDGAVISGG
jgi:hypothetical protein